MPTAASLHYCKKFTKKEIEGENFDEIKCDILHLGTLYDNRKEFLIKIAPWVKKNKYKMILTGMGNEPTKVPKELHEFFVPIDKISTIPAMDRLQALNHADTVLLYNCAKIVLNINRLTIDLDRKISSNIKYRVEGESLNPRCYEVPMSGSVLATDKIRKEYKMFKWKPNDERRQIIAFEDVDEFMAQAKPILESETYRNKIRENAFGYAAKNHSYKNRAARLMRYILINLGKKQEALAFMLQFGIGTKK